MHDVCVGLPFGQSRHREGSGSAVDIERNFVQALASPCPVLFLSSPPRPSSVVAAASVSPPPHSRSPSSLLPCSGPGGLVNECRSMKSDLCKESPCVARARAGRNVETLSHGFRADHGGGSCISQNVGSDMTRMLFPSFVIFVLLPGTPERNAVSQRRKKCASTRKQTQLVPFARSLAPRWGEDEKKRDVVLFSLATFGCVERNASMCPNRQKREALAVRMARTAGKTRRGSQQRRCRQPDRTGDMAKGPNPFCTKQYGIQPDGGR